MPELSTTDYLALKRRIGTLVTTPTLARFEPDEIFTPASDAIGPLPFLTISDAVNDPVRMGIRGVPNVRSGTLMLTVMWPIARPVSHVQLKELAGQIAAHFPEDLCLSYGPSRLRVTQDSAPLQPYVDGPYRVCVVRVFWTSLA